MKTFSIPESHLAGRVWPCGHVQTACCTNHLDNECPLHDVEGL